jgi:HK97 family phage major capsid protein
MDAMDVLNEVKNLINTQADLTKKSIEELKTKGAVPSEYKEKMESLAKDNERLTNEYNSQKALIDEQKETLRVLDAKIKEIEQNPGGVDPEELKSIGEKFVESKEFKDCVTARTGISRKYEIGSFWLQKVDSITSIRNAGTLGTATDLTNPQRLSGITGTPNVPLTIRALLPVGRTQNNMIEFVKENVFTNNAGPQFSPVSPTANSVYEGALKNKSNITFTLVQRPVSTIAHYMKASRQIIDDAPMLQSEINNRLLYGLALEEEEQLLLGDGNNGNQLGIIPQATAYDTNLNVSGDTKIDKIRHALLQVTLSKYLPTAIVLAPKDWHDIELTKTEEGGANKGAYLLSNPAMATDPRLWGYRVVPSLSMTAGDFLVGNFATGAQIFDRMNATVEVARQNEDDFVRNMISILAEERLALAVYNGASFVEGTF